MYKRIALLLLTFIFTVFAVACSNQGDENDAQNNEEESSQSKENENNEGNQENGEENKSNLEEEQNDDETSTEVNDAQGSNGDPNVKVDVTTNNESSNSSSNGELPEPIEINEEVQDAGVTFTLEDITFKDNHISVRFHASNTKGHSVSLAGAGRAKGDDLGGITLIDDTGYEYRYIAEMPDHRIKIMDGEEVTGNVSFAGKIQDDAKSLTLVFNPDESDEERKPMFSFENIEIKR